MEAALFMGLAKPFRPSYSLGPEILLFPSLCHLAATVFSRN
jgi:hypothetical protein